MTINYLVPVKIEINILTRVIPLIYSCNAMEKPHEIYFKLHFQHSIQNRFFTDTELFFLSLFSSVD